MQPQDVDVDAKRRAAEQAALLKRCDRIAKRQLSSGANLVLISVVKDGHPVSRLRPEVFTGEPTSTRRGYRLPRSIVREGSPRGRAPRAASGKRRASAGSANRARGPDDDRPRESDDAPPLAGRVCCAECGYSFAPARSDAYYCSSACKQRAYRERERHDAALTRRAEAARALLRAGEIEPWEALYLVVVPTTGLKQVSA